MTMMIDAHGIDERIRLLQISVAGQPSGQLLQQSDFEYRYQRSPGDPKLEDHTLALRLWSGKTRRSKAYPLPDELRRFGRDICGVRQPQAPLHRIAQAMADTLTAAERDPRIPAGLLGQLRPVWESAIRYMQ